jgi:hypothetical protein
VKSAVIAPVIPEPAGAKREDDRKIEIKLGFPVGPGGDGHSSGAGNVGREVGGQVLDQLLKDLIFD